MKILFVDDESKKLKRLYSAISQVEGIWTFPSRRK